MRVGRHSWPVRCWIRMRGRRGPGSPRRCCERVGYAFAFWQEGPLLVNGVKTTLASSVAKVTTIMTKRSPN